jgi:hypothetical protein
MALRNPKPDETGELKCYSCAIWFSVAPEVLAAWKRSGQTFYCPNGHGQCFGSGEIGRLKEALQTAQGEASAARSRWQAAEARANSERAAREKAEAERGELLTRTCAGQCPFCSREFQNVQKHIAARHADGKREPDKPRNARPRRQKAAGSAPDGERAAEG